MKKIIFLILLLVTLLLIGTREGLWSTETNPFYIEINLDQRLLYVYDNAEQVASYQVAVGKPSTPTPIGEYRIINKQINWGDGFGTRWLGLNVPWGIYGIHGTNKPASISGAVSHGCIRMYNSDVEELYALVPMGTRVKITGQAWRITPPSLGAKRGDSGQTIVFLQQKLNDLGFWSGFADGYFGETTESALRYFQAYHYLPQTGIVDEASLLLLFP